MDIYKNIKKLYEKYVNDQIYEEWFTEAFYNAEHSVDYSWPKVKRNHEEILIDFEQHLSELNLNQEMNIKGNLINFIFNLYCEIGNELDKELPYELETLCLLADVYENVQITSEKNVVFFNKIKDRSNDGIDVRDYGNEYTFEVDSNVKNNFEISLDNDQLTLLQNSNFKSKRR